MAVEGDLDEEREDDEEVDDILLSLSLDSDQEELVRSLLGGFIKWRDKMNDDSATDKQIAHRRGKANENIQVLGDLLKGMVPEHPGVDELTQEQVDSFISGLRGEIGVSS